ncbi:MAG: F0F1 ATP synthase subunit A [Candidatus Doudnabacteria bacterium]|nr:F0F1 ATP synthase subunit A [Candidatus Doudnabacteria bacterium]
MVNSILATVLLAIFAFFLNKGVKKYYPKGKAPKGVLNFFEAILEFLLGYIDGVTKDRKKSLKFLPIVGGLFLFILISNWMGLLPGTGSIGFWHGEELVPLLRPANTDLNMTLSMAVFAVILSHVFGVFTIGFFKYANKFIKLGDLYHAVASLNPMKMMVAFIEFFVGLIEIFSEGAKMVSLSLRLFGNIFAGEVLLTVIGSLISGYGAFFIPLPFMALELIVGVVQATVFSMLTLVYLTIATTPVTDHAETHHVEAAEDQTPTV